MVGFLSLSLTLAVLCSLATVDATQSMRRPANYKSPIRQMKTEANPEVHQIHKRAGEYASIGYFPNWSIYGMNFQPTQIIASQWTHILYSFADTSPETGAIKLTDTYADEEKHFPGDSWSETGNNLYGCLKQLYLLKLQNRNLKVLLSIGGWTYSQSGHFAFVTSPSKRAKFVADAVTFVKDYGFDGIDVDFEYPSTPAEGAGLADLMTELRTALDNFARSNGDSVPYIVSAAVAAGTPNYDHYVVPQMNAAMDFWNLMAYDYAGSWLTFSDNQANVYGGARTGFSTHTALQRYVNAGATRSKITMGIPLYGRAFENTAGLGASYSGVSGDIDVGVYAYSSLPLAGAQVYENVTDVSSYSYDAAKKQLISYDTPNITKMKVNYIKDQGLGGAMFWQIAIDKVGSGSLVDISNQGLGTLDSTQNHINFPNSKWDNVKNNMGSGGSNPTSTAPNPGPTGGCGGVSAWSSTAVYTGGMQCSYNGRLYTAKWWTQGETPGSADVWTDAGAC